MASPGRLPALVLGWVVALFLLLAPPPLVRPRLAAACRLSSSVVVPDFVSEASSSSLMGVTSTDSSPEDSVYTFG